MLGQTPLRIEENTKDLIFKVFPNPAKDLVENHFL
jgi:hypothetical protein